MLNMFLSPLSAALPDKSLTELVGLVRNDLANAVFMLDKLLQQEKREKQRAAINEVVNGLLLSNESLRLIAKHYDIARMDNESRTLLKPVLKK